MDFNKFVTIQILLMQTFNPIAMIGGMFMQITQGLMDMSSLCQLLKEADIIHDKVGAIELNARTEHTSG